MTNDKAGHQRLSLRRLRQWEALQYGMFIHFGMSTFDGNEYSTGDSPASMYNPDQLDVDQWVSVARDAGMKYAVLTAKHVSGFCLWPSELTDYQVMNSPVRVDVVERFMRACERRGVLPGLYYCSWDNHHRFGSMPWNSQPHQFAFTTRRYRDFQMAQVHELLTRYGPVMETWIDIPGLLGHDGRREQYDAIVADQPETIIMMNTGWGDGTKVLQDFAWPTDLMAIERWLPHSDRGYRPWHHISPGLNTIRIDPLNPPLGATPGDRVMRQPLPALPYYLPGEVCDPIGYEWFHVDSDELRSDEELLGMRLISRARKCNFLLDVPPDRSGRIPSQTVDALMRMRQRFESVSDDVSEPSWAEVGVG